MGKKQKPVSFIDNVGESIKFCLEIFHGSKLIYLIFFVFIFRYTIPALGIFCYKHLVW